MKARILCFGLMLWAFGHADCAMAGATTELAELFVRVMSKAATKTVSAAKTPAEEAFLRNAPAMERAAEILGRNASAAERERTAKILESIVLAEYARQGMEFRFECLSCYSRLKPDLLDARAIDLVKAHDDILVRLTSAPRGTLTLLDESGKAIANSAEYGKVLDEMEELFAPAMAKAKQGKSGSTFARTLAATLKEQGGLEVEYDAKENLGTVTFSSKRVKGKIAKVDLGKMVDKGRYLLYGGGLASLGYGASKKSGEKDEDGPRLGSPSMKRVELLHDLSSLEKEALFTDARAHYLVEQVQMADKKKATAKN